MSFWLRKPGQGRLENGGSNDSSLKCVQPTRCNSLTFHSFCPTRWIEGIKIMAKHIQIARHWETQRKRKRPNNKFYENLVKCYTDNFIPEKLQFFIDIASQLKGFLETFQTDKPMVPFLEESIVDIFQTLIKMLIKTEMRFVVVGQVPNLLRLIQENLKILLTMNL